MSFFLAGALSKEDYQQIIPFENPRDQSYLRRHVEWVGGIYRRMSSL